MKDIRKFGWERAKPVPRPGVVGVSAAVIQLPTDLTGRFSEEELRERYRGKPIVLDQPTAVISLHFGSCGEIDEHDAPYPILFMVVQGSGFVRVGGPEGETLTVQVGDAVLWPANVPHKAWTDGEAMQAIVVEYVGERAEES